MSKDLCFARRYPSFLPSLPPSLLTWGVPLLWLLAERRFRRMMAYTSKWREPWRKWAWREGGREGGKEV